LAIFGVDELADCERFCAVSDCMGSAGDFFTGVSAGAGLILGLLLLTGAVFVPAGVVCCGGGVDLILGLLLFAPDGVVVCGGSVGLVLGLLLLISSVLALTGVVFCCGSVGLTSPAKNGVCTVGGPFGSG